MDFIEVARVELPKDELAVPSNSVIKHTYVSLLYALCSCQQFLGKFEDKEIL